MTRARAAFALLALILTVALIVAAAAVADAAPPRAPAPPMPADAMEALRASTVDLGPGWRFRTDPSDEGASAGWAGEAFDDSGWATIEAGRDWETQGFEGYDGVGWYRRWIDVPAAWSGSTVRLAAGGIDDEYDVYVNGVFVRHHGERPDRSVWNWQTYTRLDERLRPGRNLLAIRVVDWGGGGGIVKAIALRRSLPMDAWRRLLPEPVLEEDPGLVRLWWEAWRMAWEKVSFGTERNGLAAAYMDEGFNEQIYQWDSCFIALFARYGRRLFPVMETLDNFYRKQRPDGYIQRCYSETDGGEVATPTPEEPVVNPPLFAWVEWAWYDFTGDRSRLARVFPVLERYYEWLKANVRRADGRGLYHQTGLGSGMDNTPRDGAAAWVDMSCQQALAADRLARIAEALGKSDRAGAWRREADEVRDLVNAHLWSDADGFYFDLRPDGTHVGVKHIGAFWALLADAADATRSARLVERLRDPKDFHRPHLFPALAASEPAYDAAGRYWLGGVWAPTNYMTVRGLRRAGRGDLARAAAENHVRNVHAVWERPPADEARIAPEERRETYRTIWECYAPDAIEPATRWDGRYLSRQDFVGWSGLGPIALLLEEVVGVEASGAGNRIVWTVERTDRHGVLRLPLGDATVDLVAAARAAPTEAVTVEVKADRAFTLELRRPGAPPRIVEIAAGETSIEF